VAGFPRVAVVSSWIRFEERAILAALRRRGIPHQPIDARQFQMRLNRARLPFDVAIIREVSSTRARYAARLLEWSGIRCVNRAATIETAGDKLLTSLALQAGHVPVPATAVALSPAAGLQAIACVGYPAVLKPLVGSWGRLLCYVSESRSAEGLLEHRAALSNPQQHIVYAQEYLEKGGRDVRIIVLGERALCAMYRRSQAWRTNVAQGARPEPCDLAEKFASPAVAAALAVGGGVLGVDLIEDPQGHVYVIEVNPVVEFEAIQSVTDVCIAEEIVDHVLKDEAESEHRRVPEQHRTSGIDASDSLPRWGGEPTGAVPA
jgi:[lysine-biosynthesis-protein LysW]---L-2-aminoadipate ligase